jgi:prefoldin subunit 5
MNSDYLNQVVQAANHTAIRLQERSQIQEIWTQINLLHQQVKELRSELEQLKKYVEKSRKEK